MILRFIFYAVIVYFVWRFLDSLFSPRARQTSPNSKRPNQKVTVQYNRKATKSKVGKDIGEYVDFEEVEDDK